jgi:hypothetical protein
MGEAPARASCERGCGEVGRRTFRSGDRALCSDERLARTAMRDAVTCEGRGEPCLRCDECSESSSTGLASEREGSLDGWWGTSGRPVDRRRAERGPMESDGEGENEGPLRRAGSVKTAGAG